MRTAPLIAIAAAIGGAGLTRGVSGPAAAELAVVTADGTVTPWWRASETPPVWEAAHPAVSRQVGWHRGQPGIEWAQLSLRGSGEARAINVVLARLEPAAVRLDLVPQATPAGRPDWTIQRTAASAGLAVNAGMFTGGAPWGWVVADGVERLRPGTGPLSSALAITNAGQVLWHDGDDVEALRRRPDIHLALQSYPTLLTSNGQVPQALLTGSAINRTHRDARLALGLDRQGRLLLALTRFDPGLPGAGRIPFGLTVPEMAALMGALGARQAMLLDGGISAQMQIRDSAGATHDWPGLRRVPLGLVVRSR